MHELWWIHLKSYLKEVHPSIIGFLSIQPWLCPPSASSRSYDMWQGRGLRSAQTSETSLACAVRWFDYHSSKSIQNQKPLSKVGNLWEFYGNSMGILCSRGIFLKGDSLVSCASSFARDWDLRRPKSGFDFEGSEWWTFRVCPKNDASRWIFRLRLKTTWLQPGRIKESEKKKTNGNKEKRKKNRKQQERVHKKNWSKEL